MTAATLFDYLDRDDRPRTFTQLQRVRAVMRDHAWHTLAQLAAKVGASEAGVSARLRDLRKSAHGGHTIERERWRGSLYRYRMVPAAEVT